VQTYDPKKVHVFFNGIPVTGYAKDTFITIERKEDAYKPYVGCDGRYTRAKVNDHSAEIKIKLVQDSPTNDLLSAVAILDEQTDMGSGVFLMTDLAGATVAKATDAWIQKMPTVERGAEVGEVEWTLFAGSLDVFAGGNI
jgi:hypothetical protein